jgi:hypothetical protein
MLMLGAHTPGAYAQEGSTLRVSVPFNFTANGTACPAGEYSFKHQQGAIDLTDRSGNVHVFMPVITSIARSSEHDDHLLAFDKVGGERILSEVWLPGNQGALVQVTKGEHEHDLVRLNRKRK